MRENASGEKPLVKEHLWGVCSSKEWCSIPSKTALGETLQWLKKQRAVRTMRSGQPYICSHICPQRKCNSDHE